MIVLIDKDIKLAIEKEICTLIGSKETPGLLTQLTWIQLESGIWLVPQEQLTFIETQIPEDLYKKIKYAGIFIGKIRKNFGLSVESLHFLSPYITRYIEIKGKTLQKYLYGNPIRVKVPMDTIKNLDLQKIIVMTSKNEPVGISSFTILEKLPGFLHLKLEPITDLGLFLRKERTMFE